MPTYEYSCDNCGHAFERVQRITENPVRKCPKCGKLKARRMIGGGGFILKGGGWESDLYSGPSNRSAKASKSGDSSSSGGESSSASKPAKADPKTKSKTASSGKSDS
ncbi:MAG: zinc ribbon domain-containing protein [Polyangiales bacterium]